MAFVKDTVKEVTTGLPPWAKAVTTFAILAGVGFAAYKMIDVINNTSDLLEANKNLNYFEKQGQKRNYTPSQYQQMADKFDSWSSETLNPFDLGNEDALWWLAKAIKSDLDFLEIEKAFGERYGHLSMNKYRLVPYISYQYDTDEVEEANKILAQNKVTSRF